MSADQPTDTPGIVVNDRGELALTHGPVIRSWEVDAKRDLPPARWTLAFQNLEDARSYIATQLEGHRSGNGFHAELWELEAGKRMRKL